MKGQLDHLNTIKCKLYVTWLILASKTLLVQGKCLKLIIYGHPDNSELQ